MADDSMADPPESLDDFQPTANSSMVEDAGGKKVTVSSDDPDVYNFDPDSLEVKQVERPPKARAGGPPRTEGVPEQEQGRIMAEIRADVEQTQQRVTDQKLKLQRIAYILDKMQTGIGEYQLLLKDKFTRFLANNDTLQADWFATITRQLPTFGDYTLVLAAEREDPIGQEGLPAGGLVPERDIHRLVDDVVTNLFGAGSLIKHHVTLCRDIADRLDDKSALLDDQLRQFPRWKAAMEAEDARMRARVHELFSLTSKIAFLGLRDPPNVPSLDATLLDLSRANATI